MIKGLLKLIGVAAVIAVVGGFVPATMGYYGLYWERYTTSLLGNPLDPKKEWYKPLEKVPGNFTRSVPKASPEENPFPDSLFAVAQGYAGNHASDSLIVAYRGKRVFEKYWNHETADSLFAAHSMTKVLPAILIGHAIADGFIESPDISASVFLPEWDDPKRRDITIRHLLNMSSGVRESYDFTPTSMRMQRAMGLDITTANLAVEIQHEPGEVFSHLNPNPQLLGVIIERATGQRFSEYLSDKLWRPIGAYDSYLFLDSPGGMVHTDCCSWSAIADWIRIGELLRNKGVYNGQQIIPAGWVDEMLTPSSANPNYGMQVWLGSEYEEYRRYDPDTSTFANYHAEPFAADDVFFLDGLGKKRVYVVPSRELVILRTGPNDSEWDDSRLPNMFINAIDKIKQRDAEAAANVVVKPAIEIIADPETVEVRDDEEVPETVNAGGTIEVPEVRVDSQTSEAPETTEMAPEPRANPGLAPGVTPEVTPEVKDSNE
jgi:CubicO group peptidase (beta-lactamase class C family)